MSATFSRTLRGLAADGSGPSALALGVVAVLLAAWLGWSFAAEVGVYAQTSSARLEVESPPQALDAPVSSRAWYSIEV